MSAPKFERDKDRNEDIRTLLAGRTFQSRSELRETVQVWANGFDFHLGVSSTIKNNRILILECQPVRKVKGGAMDPAVKKPRNSGKSTFDLLIHEKDTQDSSAAEVGALSAITLVEEAKRTALDQLVLHVPLHDPVTGFWKNSTKNSAQPEVLSVLQRGPTSLSDLLKAQDQPLFNLDFASCAARVLVLELNGIAPCRCPIDGGFLVWAYLQELWVCNGHYSSATGARACDYTTKTPKCVTFETTEIDPPKLASCCFKLDFRYSEKQGCEGWKLDESRSFFQHHEMCLGSNRRAGAFVKEKLQSISTVAGRVSDNQLSSTLNAIPGLNNVPRSSLRRCIVQTHEDEEAQMIQNNRKFPGWAKLYVESNPGSTVHLLVQDNATRAVSSHFICSGSTEFKPCDLALERDFSSLLHSAMHSNSSDQVLLAKRSELLEIQARIDFALEDQAVAAKDLERCKLDLIYAYAYPKQDGIPNSGEQGVEYDHPSGCTVVAVTVVYGAVVNVFKTAASPNFFFDGQHCKNIPDGKILSYSMQDTLGHILPLADTFCFHEDAFSLALGPAALRGSGIELNSPARIANSDRSKASYTLLGGVLRFCHHRVCEEHFLRNAVHHCGALDDHGKTQFRACFRALTSSSFEQNWQELQRCHPKHAAYLDQEPRQNWASYTFVERGLSSFGVVNNNFAESHASRLLHGSEHVREQTTVLRIFEAMVNQTSQAFVKIQREVNADNSTLGSKVMAKIDEGLSRAHMYTAKLVDASHGGVYSVEFNSDGASIKSSNIRIVRPTLRLCTCGAWTDLQIPCVHAICVGLKNAQNALIVTDWVNPKYLMSNLKLAYCTGLIPVAASDAELGEGTFGLPREFVLERRRSGGQKKSQKRIPSIGENAMKPRVEKQKEQQ